MDIALALVAVVAAAMVGAAGVRVVRRLPEPVPHPEEPDHSKIPYADLGRSPRTEAVLAVLAAVLMGLAATALPIALLPVWVAVCGVGAWLAWVDWRTQLLPFLLTTPLHVAALLLLTLAAALTRDWSLLWSGLLANVVVFAIFWLIWFIGVRVGSTFGYGDVRLSGVLGLALGPLGLQTTLYGVYAGFLLGAVGGIVLSRLGIVDRKGFAFGPYMVVGAAIGLAVAPLV